MAGTLEADVLVVGGGGAALRAAIEAQEAGARVVLAVKGRLAALGLRGSGATGSGTAADRRGFWPVDGLGEHLPGALEDILQLGLGMADAGLARIVAEETPASYRVLQRLGVHFQSVGGTASKEEARTGYTGFRGKAVLGIVPTLAAALRRTGAKILERTMVTRLLVRDGECAGAVTIDEENGEVMSIRAGAVILGTGGAVQLFRHNFHPPCVTGDGYAMGYAAGAELMNLEFMQFFIGTVHPTVNNLSNWPWGQDIRVYNARGEQFLDEYLDEGALAEARRQAVKHGPFTTRDSLSRYLFLAIAEEVRCGRGTSHGGVYMDLTSPQVKVPEERDGWLRYRGIEWDREPFEVTVAAMCFNGGLRVDGDAQTTVPRLYAVGESSSGMYGADRHGGNMMGASQVFGARAGRHAARTAMSGPRPDLPMESIAQERTRVESLDEPMRNETASGLLRRLRDAAWADCLVSRSETGLRSFLETIAEIGQERGKGLRVEGPLDIVEVLELDNLLVVGEMLARAALARTESRGGHYRVDFPKRDDERWLKSTVIRNVDGQMALGSVVLDPGWKDRPGDMRGERWG